MARKSHAPPVSRDASVWRLGKRGPGRPRKAEKSFVPSPSDVVKFSSLGLPSDYGSLGVNGGKAARFKSLRSWFDPDPSRSHVLCTDVDAFVRAHRLWVEYYLKPDPHNAGIYHSADPLHKYDMVRMAMVKAKTEKHPAKAACHAPRGSSKTITLIQEMCSMIAVCRTTRVSVLISEMNADRTAEEIRGLRCQIEGNEHIHRDFGGAGVLFPKGRAGGERWNDTTLSFQHNKSTIMGFSISSRQRGRHPTLGIIDDPEDEDLSRNPDWRRKFFRWLFKTYLPMFRGGGKIMWIGTLIHEFSCLQLALKGRREVQSGDDDVELERDERFDDWDRRVWALIEEDPATGERWSIWPDYVGVKEFDAYKKSYGLAAALSEYQGICIGSGELVFHRDPHRHGFMRCLAKDDADDDYMLDLRTGRTAPWKEFIDSLYVVGAGDLSDSVAAAADPGALVFIGASVDGVVYVLDAYIRRSHADQLVKKGYDMAALWGTQKIGWEKAAMSSVVVRYAARYADELRREGLSPPLSRGIVNNKQDKVRRILAAIVPLVNDYEIRFLCCEDFTDGQGVVHVTKPNPHARYHRILKEQIDGFTDEGASGHDDGPDALEMAIRLLGRSRGVAVGESESDVPGASIQKWADAGITWPKHMIPMACWTEEMLSERFKPDAALDQEMDPYE